MLRSYTYMCVSVMVGSTCVKDLGLYVWMLWWDPCVKEI